MKKRNFLPILFLLLVYACGCVPLLIGGAAGALGAYAVSKDTIQGDTDKTFDRLYNAAYKVTRYMGEITQEDGLRGFIGFNVLSSQVEVRLSRMTRSTTRMRVSARKHHLPNIELAQEVYTKIMEEAK